MERAFVGLPGCAAERAVDVELLEHQLEGAPTDVDHVLDAKRGDRAVEPLERRQHVVDDVVRGEGALDEVVLDVLVLEPAQEYAATACERAPGASDLLVVGNRRAGGLEVDTKLRSGLS